MKRGGVSDQVRARDDKDSTRLLRLLSSTGPQQTADLIATDDFTGKFWSSKLVEFAFASERAWEISRSLERTFERLVQPPGRNRSDDQQVYQIAGTRCKSLKTSTTYTKRT